MWYGDKEGNTMKNYIFETTATMKEYNNNNLWVTIITVVDTEF